MVCSVVHDAGLVTAPRWRQTVDSFGWRPGDLLAVGSSEHSRLASVFPGSTATRILRHSPAPVVILPAGRG